MFLLRVSRGPLTYAVLQINSEISFQWVIGIFSQLFIWQIPNNNLLYTGDYIRLCLLYGRSEFEINNFFRKGKLDHLVIPD